LNSYVIFFGIPNFGIGIPIPRFFKSGIHKKNLTGIFGIKNGIRIPLPMGVPEIRTKNWNSQPRLKEELLQAFQLVYAYLTAWGFKLQLHKMDNKTSHNVKTFICKENTCLQYTPPDIHRTNQAEWEIFTWKNHFLSGILGLPKTFPIANWCCLTNQTDFTLNMLWLCRQNPALLAFEALEWSYSFDALPMAPLGTKVLAHHESNHCSSWGFHALNAWYISPSLQHYCCIKIIMRNTDGKCITDTFRYKYHTIPIPVVTATDHILEAIHRLTAAI
jgi:hypothetical protein